MPRAPSSPALPWLAYHSYLTHNVFKVVLQKSIPTQIRQLFIHIINSKGYVDGFVGELTFATDFKNTLCEVNSEADMLGVRNKFVDFGVGRRPG